MLLTGTKTASSCQPRFNTNAPFQRLPSPCPTWRLSYLLSTRITTPSTFHRKLTAPVQASMWARWMCLHLKVPWSYKPTALSATGGLIHDGMRTSGSCSLTARASNSWLPTFRNPSRFLKRWHAWATLPSWARWAASTKTLPWRVNSKPMPAMHRWQ